ncbi:MAG: hypothetical protein PHY95_04710 [Candidatus ainarchaeum sp.]|nr:hypothetical protein [Candidatus ainarchaeum sp.]
MVMKEKEAPREEASERLRFVPVQNEAGSVIPIRREDLDCTIHTLSRLNERVVHMAEGHDHFGDVHSASSHAHSVEKWEALPINAHHTSEKHHYNERLFEKIRNMVP